MTKVQKLFLAALLAGAWSPMGASAQGVSIGGSASGSTATGEASATTEAEATAPAAPPPATAAPEAAPVAAPTASTTAAPAVEAQATEPAAPATTADAPVAATTAAAPEPVAQAAELDASADVPAADDDASEPDQFGSPWGVEPGTWELGLYWGLFFADGKHELYDAADLSVAFQKLEKVTPQLGLRAGYFPLRLIGVELEAGLMPSQTRLSGDGVNLYTLRAHAVLLAPTKTIVPFVVVGGGALGISSDQQALGSDLDGAFHVGIGAKAFVSRDIAVRLDLRDNITAGQGDNDIAQHFEALIGISVVHGRAEPPPPPADADGDTVSDDADKCPSDAGPAPDGCPPPPDTDGDGIADDVDNCPAEAGIPSSEAGKNGCPPPPPDADGDGVPDASDKCPEVAGDSPDGCLADTDGDGIVNRDDKCADQPETKNGYEDTDGCPDELPETVKKFTGALPGISFEASQATIRPVSFKTLDEAAKVLVEYPALRVEITGHTDNSGKAEKNQELSAARAEAVKTYLVGKGVTEDRVVTRGAGQAEPVADNATAAGRAQNRRIELKLIQQ